MSSFDNIIAVGSTDPTKARVMLFQTAGKFMHVPASEMGFPTLAGNNVFTGTNTFSGPTNLTAGLIHGLTLSNGTDATNDIDIAVGGAASDDTAPTVMALTGALTKRLDADWAVGSGNGGKMSAAALTNTTYHVWLIQRSDTGVVDAGFDVSATAPTMPANYDRKRRIGSIVRISGAIRAFTQTGDVFVFTDPFPELNSTNPGTSAVTPTLAIPAGLILEAFGNVSLTTNVAAADQIMYVSDPRSSNVAPDTTQYFTLVYRSTGALARHSAQWRVFCNTSAQIRYRLSASDANTIVRLNTVGWVDTRGR